jgi:hypothetical protein
MKKKLEADLVSIAHRILKQKNREELDQLLQETLKLYEKLLVLKFVDEQFGDAEPTIGHASALFKLEETYGLEEPVHVKANEQEAKEEEVRAKKAEEKEEEEPKQNEAPEQDKENENGEGVVTEPGEEEAASDLEKEETEESGEEVPAKAAAEKPEEDKDEPETNEEEVKEAPTTEVPAVEEPKEAVEKEAPAAEEPEIESPKAEATETKEVPAAEAPKAEEQSQEGGQDKDNESGEGVATTPEEVPVSEEEKEYTEKEEDKTPSQNAADFTLGFERKTDDAPVKQKEISFEDYHDYKEPEFVKKDSVADTLKTPVPPDVKAEIKAGTDTDWQNWEPKKSEPEAPKAAPKFDWEANLNTGKTEVTDDWKNWEPIKAAEPEKPATPSFNWNEPEPAEPKQGFSWDEPKKELVKETEKPAAPKTLNDSFGKTISLALNDRIAFEKHLFAGSSDDLNRVISQLNTLNSHREAQNFIEDLVKPDYNNWTGKEEYEERFMAIVEKRFN